MDFVKPRAENFSINIGEEIKNVCEFEKQNFQSETVDSEQIKSGVKQITPLSFARKKKILKKFLAYSSLFPIA